VESPNSNPQPEFQGFGFAPVAEETPASTEDKPDAIITELPASTEPKAATVESPVPQVIREAFIPQELLDFYANDDTPDLIAEIKSQTPYQYLRQEVAAKYPSATTDDEIDFWMNKEHPDLDPSIPENLGLSMPEYKELVRRVDGSKQVRIDSVKAARIEKIEAIKKEATPAPVNVEPDEVVNERLRSHIQTYVDKQVASFDKNVLPKFEGFNVPELNMEEVRNRALEANRLIAVEYDGRPDVMPDVVGVATEMRLRAYIDVLEPMAKAYQRLDPELTKQAVLQSLNNAPLQNSAPAVDPTRNNVRDETPAFGFGSGQFPGENGQQ